MPCTCGGIGMCAYCDWNGFKTGPAKHRGGHRMIERDEEPEAAATPAEDPEMFFKWKPDTESADTDTEDDGFQMRSQMGEISINMPTKKPAGAKSSAKRKPAGASAGMKKSTSGAKKKPARTATK